MLQELCHKANQCLCWHLWVLDFHSEVEMYYWWRKVKILRSLKYDLEISVWAYWAFYHFFNLVLATKMPRNHYQHPSNKYHYWIVTLFHTKRNQFFLEKWTDVKPGEKTCTKCIWNILSYQKAGKQSKTLRLYQKDSEANLKRFPH